MFQMISKYNIQLVALLIYVTFVFVKFDVHVFFTDNKDAVQISLIDWNDDKLLEDKEFSTEKNIDRVVQILAVNHSKSVDLEPDFFYNRIYKEIKLTISTPPPRI